MPTTYEKLKESDRRHKAVLQTMQRFHGPLSEAQVSVTLLLAAGPRDENGDPHREQSRKI